MLRLASCFQNTTALQSRNTTSQSRKATPAHRTAITSTVLCMMIKANCITMQAVPAQPRNSMQTAFDSSIRPKLDAIDKVRHHLTGVDIELPAIVVVGDQSSGKSSVLESLSGIGLPRGGNLVTRCPLELALRRGPQESARLSYTDPADSSKEITKALQLADIPEAVQSATKHLAGDNSGLVPALISLKVVKPDAPDLTLIDLPGIVRNPIGDQPQDIEQQIRDLIFQHIEGDSKVVLCVLPATADFATQEAIKISRKVDPSGKRTVGVVTKVDLAEPGIKDRLEATGADHLRLELGYVAVRSRTAVELQQGISSAHARANEAHLFATHAELKEVAPEYKGIPALSSKLVQIQAERIQSHLPALQKQVNNKLRDAEGRMHKMQGVISTDVEAEKCLSGLLDQLHRRVHGLRTAAPEVSAGDHKAKELHIAPRVNEMFVSYQSELWEAIGGKEVFKTSDCHDILREHTEEVKGVTVPNIMGDRVFNSIFAQEVYSNLKPSAKELVENVHKYMEDVLWRLTEDVADAFPRLQTAMKALIQQQLESLAKQATTNAMYVIKGEKHVFTNNARYMELLNKMQAHVIKGEKHVFTNNARYMELLNKMQAHVMLKRDNADDFDAEEAEAADEDLAHLDVLQSGNDNDDRALVDLQLGLAAYTHVVIKSLCDSIPKLVYAQLVAKVGKSLSSIIRDGLTCDPDVTLIDFMHDPQRVAVYRQLQEMTENLKKAHATLRKL